MKNILITIIAFISFSAVNLAAESTQLGVQYDVDTSFVFTPAKDLTKENNKEIQKTDYFAVGIVFSNSGLGLGFNYQYALTPDLSLSAGLFFSGAQNTDEFEIWDGSYMDYRVPNKINRLYRMPFTIGLKYRLFSASIGDRLRPYITAGGGGAYILATPYEREFFSAFSYANNYVKPAVYAGMGVDVMSGKNAIYFGMKYYYIPFGGNGLESIINKPIQDFGGLFLELGIGFSI